MAEILAGEATRMVMERRFPIGATDEEPIASLYVYHSKYLSKYLKRCHKALVPEARLEKGFKLIATSGDTSQGAEKEALLAELVSTGQS